MLQNLSFEVAEAPVLYDFNGNQLQSKTHKCMIKAETGEQLSVMKNSYNAMLTADFMETTERMKEISGFEIAGYSEIDGGRIILSHLKNTIEDFTIGGHKIDDYLVLGNSFDGRYSFFLGTSTVLLRCKNQFSRLTRAEKVRNTKSAPKKREELLRGLEIYFTERKKMYQNFEKMRDIKVDAAVRELALDYIFQVSQEDRLEGKVSTRKQNTIEEVSNWVITESGELGDNAWGLLNGVTYWTTHVKEQKDNSFGNLFGTNSRVNERAYDFAKQLVLS